MEVIFVARHNQGSTYILSDNWWLCDNGDSSEDKDMYKFIHEASSYYTLLKVTYGKGLAEWKT